ncbi:GH25 family lysozyme [Oligoflexaceae bacterium]|nr:GH25 family lysozyme [Oligoflexaceae bacterium]
MDRVKVNFTLRWIVTPAIVLLGIAATAYYCLQNGYVRFNYPSRDNYPVQGVDVSHHQGDIDWAKLASTGLRFAYIKATEGGDFKDKRFLQNWSDARTHGFIAGAYHFFTFCRPVKDQIANIMRSVPQAADSLPVAIDLEFGGNCKRMPQPASLLNDIRFMADELSRYYGKAPLLYLTPEFDEAYPEIRKMGLKIWIRNIYFEPSDSEVWTVWQYSNRGLLPGVEVPVDLNVFRGSASEFKEFYRGSLASSLKKGG